MLAVVAASAALSIAGCASAVSQAAVSGHTPVAATVKEKPTNSGNVHILLYSINTDGVNFQAIVTGSIGDYGPAVSVYPNGKADASHSGQLELKLTRGSFRLNIAALDKAFAASASAEPIYPQTCSDFTSVTASAPIVAGSGAGSYRVISGSFAMTVTLN